VRISDADYQALSAFRRGLREFLAFSETQARAAGLTPQQHQALLAIRGHAERRLSVGALADDLLIKPHSALELANRLVAAGLARRAPAKTDRRIVMLTLTRKAETVLARLSEAHMAELARQRRLLADFMEWLPASPPARRR
jgi:DNA-binding MarR family transcriptional regulator